MDIREQFGRIIRELRLAAGLSQEELAHRAGMNVTYLSDLENGKSSPSLVMLVDLSRALSKHPSEMLRDLKIDETTEGARKRPVE